MYGLLRLTEMTQRRSSSVVDSLMACDSNTKVYVNGPDLLRFASRRQACMPDLRSLSRSTSTTQPVTHGAKKYRTPSRKKFPSRASKHVWVEAESSRDPNSITNDFRKLLKCRYKHLSMQLEIVAMLGRTPRGSTDEN